MSYSKEFSKEKVQEWYNEYLPYESGYKSRFIEYRKLSENGYNYNGCVVFDRKTNRSYNATFVYNESLAFETLQFYINIKIDFEYNKSFEEFLKTRRFIIKDNCIIEQKNIIFIGQNRLENQIYNRRL